MATATAEPTIAAPVTPLPDLIEVTRAFEAVLAAPEPTLAPVPPQSVKAASEGHVSPVDGAIPWFVPYDRHADYLACLDDPQRHTVSELIWSRSVEAGYPGGWIYDEAMYVVTHEGGDDLCQFNTQGSGACGPFQLLTCPADGLTFDGQLAGAFAKFQDGKRIAGVSPFWAHWFQWWAGSP